MVSSKNKKRNVYPCKPQFYCIKCVFWGAGARGVKGFKIIKAYFRDVFPCTAEPFSEGHTEKQIARSKETQ